VSSLAAERPARARLGRWPYDDRVAHLVLLDHNMVPNDHDVNRWIDEAKRQRARTVRTGALFPNATAPFLESGFRVVDTLALLARPVRGQHETAASSESSASRHDRPRDRVRLRRLRPSMLIDAAEIDRRAFSTLWANDVTALGDIMTATPFHRSRSVHVDGRMVAFSISGRADHAGYVQRLAVDPSARRRGFAQLLLGDALRWMQRRSVNHAMVNTAVDNRAALALYEAAGFERQPGSLLILERPLR
jgi:ribosomal protein S18 acetylase RimI-like enzyme